MLQGLNMQRNWYTKSAAGSTHTHTHYPHILREMAIKRP